MLRSNSSQHDSKEGTLQANSWMNWIITSIEINLLKEDDTLTKELNLVDEYQLHVLLKMLGTIYKNLVIMEGVYKEVYYQNNTLAIVYTELINEIEELNQTINNLKRKEKDDNPNKDDDMILSTFKDTKDKSNSNQENRKNQIEDESNKVAEDY